MQIRGRLHVTGLIDHRVLREAWNRAVVRIGHRIAGAYRINLSGRLVVARTGALLRSVRMITESSPGGLLRVRVGAESFKGAILEVGAIPHEIRARGRLLRFRASGRWVTTGRVQHPGLVPRRPLAMATGDGQAEMEHILQEEFEIAAAHHRVGRLPKTG